MDGKAPFAEYRARSGTVCENEKRESEEREREEREKRENEKRERRERESKGPLQPSTVRENALGSQS